ncbi:MAG: hypothetical protein Ct9H300mP28_03580 [Pseudomonadota bacterium]|nr:MAG: hypothetical protein Ct9H300mP28_03580 [Pseudomonadota bacterium]
MNLLLGIIAAFLYGFWHKQITILAGVPLLFLLKLFIIINFNLFLFNLIPLGPLEGNFPYSPIFCLKFGDTFSDWNFRYGSYALMGPGILSIAAGFQCLQLDYFNQYDMTNGLL